MDKETITVDKRADLLEVESAIFDSEDRTIAQRYLSELLSYSTVRDPEAAARELISEHGSIDAVTSRDTEELVRSVGESAAILLKLLAYTDGRRVYDGFRFGRRNSDAEIIELLSAMMRGLSRETVYMVSVDARGAVIACDMIGEGTVNASDVYPRKLAERAIKRGAAEVYLAHNHPSGTAGPSDDDVSSTARVFATLRASGIRMRAHAVVAEREVRLMVPNEKTGEIDITDAI